MKKIIIVLFTLVVVGTIVSPFFLPVSKIECISQFGSCSEELSREIEVVDKSFFLETKKILTEKLDSDSKIKGYQINYQFPQKLSLYVFERKPEIAVLRKNDNKYILTDRDGFILGQVEQTQLPIMEIVEVGHTQEQLRLASELFYELFSVWDIKKSELKADALWVKNSNGQRIAFPLEGDIDVILGSYTLVLSWLKSENKDFTIESNSISEIDFRFRNPVIRI